MGSARQKGRFIYTMYQEKAMKNVHLYFCTARATIYYLQNKKRTNKFQSCMIRVYQSNYKTIPLQK